MAKKFSQFPSAASISPGDSVVGLKDGENTRFSFATFLSFIQSLFVPTSRKINNKPLTADITLDASDIGAVDASDVGVADGVAGLDSNGKVPSSQLPPISSDAEDITYDPTTSGASATNVQDALDEAFDDLDGKQDEITASGILKGDGAGGVSAATPGTDYGTYSKPSGGIPSTDMTSAVQTSLGKADTAYQKPSSGIPSSDMASGVQTSLGKADTAYQKPSGGIPASDLANGVIPTVPSAYTSNPAMDGTASPGSSGAWAKGDHVHPSDTSRVPVYGMGKNLLDNAYFVGGGSQLGDGVFPINQRGQAQYTLSSGVYTVDLWRAYKYSGSATVNLTADGLEISGEDCAFSQKVKVSTAELLGKTVTLSALIDGNLLSKTAVMPTSFNQNSNVISIAGTGINVGLVSRPAPAGWTNAYYVVLATVSTAVKVIKAVKLEFGTEQSLAHQENGVWVLNEIPDYETEWNKCRKYLRVYYRDSTYAKSMMLAARFSHESRTGFAQFAVYIDPPMASAPTVTNNNALAIRTITSSDNVANVTFSFSNSTIDTLVIRADSSNITAGTLYWVDTLNAGNRIILSAEP